MSVLVVGLSHKSAPVATLERAVVGGDDLTKLLRDVSQAGSVAGAFVVSTCNRVEVYAEVDKFHGGVASISELLARHSGLPLSELTPHLYVHYEDRAVQHLLAVTCGLESMVIGESQILGQVRQSLGFAREQGTLSRILGDLGALALRTAKRAHTETGIDRAGANVVGVGIRLAAVHLTTPAGSPSAGSPSAGSPSAGSPPAGLAGAVAPSAGLAPAGLAGAVAASAGSAGAGSAADSANLLRGRSVLVVGAGSLSSLAVTTAARMGAVRIVVANRTPDRARRLAAAVSGTTADLEDLTSALADADLVISCTGAAGLVISADEIARALLLRAGPARDRDRDTAKSARRPLVLLDLALPRDVEEAAGRLAGVSLISLATLGEAADSGLGGQITHRDDVAAVRAIVAEEFEARVSAEHAARVAPTVVALRAKAAEVVDAELARLAGRLNTVDARTHSEVARAMRRVVDKLLHSPTVRVKELAGSPGGDSYEDALRVLFDLDPAAIEAVTRADVGLVRPAGQDAPADVGLVRPARQDGPSDAGLVRSAGRDGPAADSPAGAGAGR
jgi:glutamyl-tRNA reductase